MFLYLFMKFCFSKAQRYQDGGKKCTAFHILIDSEEKALEIKKELEQFKEDKKALWYNFSRQAFTHSKCPSGKNLGSLGTFGPGQMVPEFDEVCWTLPLDTVSDPVKTQFGYHLIMVEDREVPEKKVDPVASAKEKKKN